MSEREPLIRSLPSKNAIRLANALYQTYITEQEPVLHIRKTLLFQLYRRIDDEPSELKIEQLFNELNEPCAVQNFEYEGKLIEWQMVSFCRLLSPITPENEYVDVEINELFLAVLRSEEEESLIAFSEIPK